MLFIDALSHIREDYVDELRRLIRAEKLTKPQLVPEMLIELAAPRPK